jgi:hypothetical protein
MELASLLMASHIAVTWKQKNFKFHNGLIGKDRRPFGHS